MEFVLSDPVFLRNLQEDCLLFRFETCVRVLHGVYNPRRCTAISKMEKATEYMLPVANKLTELTQVVIDFMSNHFCKLNANIQKTTCILDWERIKCCKRIHSLNGLIKITCIINY